jgi:hypothetical protein
MLQERQSALRDLVHVIREYLKLSEQLIALQGSIMPVQSKN